MELDVLEIRWGYGGVTRCKQKSPYNRGCHKGSIF
jgi:hypothetical protein